VNNSFRSRVNAHLRKAAALLEHSQAIQVEQGSRLTQDALVESSLFQLHLTLVNFLREIAANYQVENAEQIASVSDLATALLQVDKQPAELTEIETSEQEGWLAELKAAYAAVYKGEPSKKSGAGIQPAGMIQTKQLSDEDLNFSRAEDWLNKSRELIERQREMMVEC
jgi:hypothetical protein